MEFLSFEKKIGKLHRRIERNRAYRRPDEAKLNRLEKDLQAELKLVYSNLEPIQVVEVARHPQRPLSSDYINAFIEDFQELAGDRRFGDDKALIAGFGKFKGQTVAVLGQERGNDIESRMFRNFGLSQPEAYRKAERILKLAEKFDIPVISFIDITGAYPGKGSEERGVHEAIASSIRAFLNVKVPTLSVVIGEGGSGGAIGIGSTDRILMLEHSIYSVISAEGCAGILWKDRKYKDLAAKALKITAPDLNKLGIVDQVIKEPLGGAHRDKDTVIENVKKAIEKNLKELAKIPAEKLVKDRAKKYLEIA